MTPSKESHGDAGHFLLIGRFGDATQVAYAFWLYDLCDTYLELIKPVVGDTSEGNKKVKAIS